MSKSPAPITSTLERLTSGDEVEEELHFDPRTGQIVVRRPGDVADPESIDRALIAAARSHGIQTDDQSVLVVRVV